MKKITLFVLCIVALSSAASAQTQTPKQAGNQSGGIAAHVNAQRAAKAKADSAAKAKLDANLKRSGLTQEDIAAMTAKAKARAEAAKAAKAAKAAAEAAKK